MTRLHQMKAVTNLSQFYRSYNEFHHHYVIKVVLYSYNFFKSYQFLSFFAGLLPRSRCIPEAFKRC